MNFQNAAFEFYAGRFHQLPASDLPEIVFSGRSNVGKSSLINKLLNRKALARVSAKPGKTGTINFYRLPECRLVDLPGYGYAKVSAAEKQRWAELVEGYLGADRKIACVVQIIDLRHEPTRDDLHMIQYLLDQELPFVIAATKSDKLNKTQREERLAGNRELFAEIDDVPLQAVSSLTGEGIEALKDHIERCCEESGASASS